MQFAQYPEIARAYMETDLAQSSPFAQLMKRLRDITSKPVR